MTTIVVNFAAPLSVNRMFRNVPGRGRVKSKAYRVWRVSAEWEARIAMRGRPPIAAPCAITLTLPKSYRGDADNTLKAVLDALEKGGVVKNDHQFRDVRVTFGEVEGTRAEITVLNHKGETQ